MTLPPIATRSAAYAAVCLTACLFSSGCRLPSRAAESSLASYGQASISYDVAGSCRSLLTAQSDIKPVAFEAEDSAKLDEGDEFVWKSAQLSMQYPHPDALPDMAQVTLRLSCQAPGQDSEVDSETCPLSRGICSDELWVLDIPKGEFDELLVELSKRDVAETSIQDRTAAHLNVMINQKNAASAQNREPQLDEFVKRVYQHGRLRGFIPCQQARRSRPAATPRFPALTQSSFQLDQKL